MQNKFLPGEAVSFLVYRYPFPGAGREEQYSTGWVVEDYPEKNQVKICYRGPSGGEVSAVIPRDKASRLKN